ncbi:MAG TPA: helix-turn-helix transcriptional regulator [Candidatus Acidoferrales bacterium]|jgi:DNA-binding XRE family transcriptional regulator|nr:helix-turn-helix transcriptional regulator [Candidatus Acidoferrales bacterium]
MRQLSKKRREQREKYRQQLAKLWATRIRTTREKRGLSQEQLAALMKVRPRVVEQIESEELVLEKLRLTVVVPLVNALKIPIDELSERPEPPDWTPVTSSCGIVAVTTAVTRGMDIQPAQLCEGMFVQAEGEQELS